MTAGVDTVSYAWRPQKDDVLDAFYARPHRPGPLNSLVCADRGPGDERLLMWPARGLLAVEGRLGAVVKRDAGDHSLSPATMLAEGATTAARTIRELLGADPGEHVEVRRYDLAAELHFDDGREGLATLRTLAGMCPARAKLKTYASNDGQVETVALITPKRGITTARFYDKGVEAKTNPPGERIRIETQLRPPKSQRQRPDVLATTDLRPHFIGRMASYVTETNATGVVAAGTEAAVDELLGQVAREELSLAKAERMLGSLVVLRRHGRAIYEDRQGRRRLHDLREHGVALEHELPPDRLVPVGELLRQAMENFAA